ncbi:hypothetical protein VNO77_20331 [Canavalia gladiata]|uniref:Uncharacterized protein n=1 Tax=Canavalia gladiata TaxID=3824 RepID=A0AAN9LTB9_CANGL
MILNRVYNCSITYVDDALLFFLAFNICEKKSNFSVVAFVAINVSGGNVETAASYSFGRHIFTLKRLFCMSNVDPIDVGKAQGMTLVELQGSKQLTSTLPPRNRQTTGAVEFELTSIPCYSSLSDVD